MERREVDRQELAELLVYVASAIPFSTTFAIWHSSQSTLDRNRGSTQRSRQM
jgi:hypothetical protein